MDKLDAQHTVPIIAPRPLLVYNGLLLSLSKFDELSKHNRHTSEDLIKKIHVSVQGSSPEFLNVQIHLQV